MKKKIIPILLLIIAILIVIDVLIRIWYHNEFNLIFSSSEFNNILTPILTIIATIIYGWALLTTMGQNKIILSQSIKPFYEKEIEKLVNKAEATAIDKPSIYANENINLINYTKYITSSLFKLTEHKHYNEDYETFEYSKDAQIITYDYLKSRSYFPEFIFLSQFTVPIGAVHFFYGDLMKLIEEINNSKLIPEDKILLKKQIQRTFLLEYLEIIRLERKKIMSFPPIPIVDFSVMPAGIKKFDQITNTDFNHYYNSFKREFDNLMANS
jgi:hypothetical protein